MFRLAGIFLILVTVTPMMMINGQNPGTPDAENKCGNCPCNNPCASSPPPPSPPPPSPPPPKKPPSNYCPPPPATPGSYVPSPPGSYVPSPPSQYIYITGPPGDVYPVDANFSGAGRSLSTVGLAIFLIMCSILQLALIR